MDGSRRTYALLGSPWMVLGAWLCVVEASEKEAPPPQAQARTELDSKVNGGVLPGTYAGLPLLWIPKRKAPEKLTGDLRDAAWKEAASFTLLGIVKKDQPKHKTEGFAFCTKEALYVGFRCHDDQPDQVKVDGDAIWKNDGVELFFEPALDALKKPYHQIIVDARGQTAFHRHHVYPLHGSVAIREAWSPQVEALTEKGEKCWTCEVRIPFDQIKLGDAALNKKTLWRLNLYRTRPERGAEPLMETGWSPPGSNRYHCASKFGFALPEVYSTQALLEEVRRNAATAPVPTVTVETEPALRYEIRKRIGELGSEIYLERLEAATRLKAIGARSAIMLKALADDLQEAVARNRDQETVLEVKRILGDVKRILIVQEDDDPPPDNLLPAVAKSDEGL